MKNQLPISVYAPNLPQRTERRKSIIEQFAVEKSLNYMLSLPWNISSLRGAYGKHSIRL